MNEDHTIPQDIESIIDRVDRRKEPGLLPGRSTPTDRYDDLMAGLYPGAGVLNLTEFEYGRSFRYTIRLSQNPDASALKQAVLEQAVRAEGAIDELSVAVSAVAPYLHVRFCHREARGAEVVTRWSDDPVTPAQAQALGDLIGAFEALGIRRIDPALANAPVPDVQTGLCDEGEATVADCLFYG